MSYEKEIQKKYWMQDQHTRRRPDHPAVLATFMPFADIVVSSVGDASHLSVLDVGCGNGFLQWALQKRFGRVAGLDSSQQMLDVNPCTEKYLGFCTNLPFADMSYDVVAAANLFHHLTEEDRIKTLLEMKRVARYSVVSFEPNAINPLVFIFSLLDPKEHMGKNFSADYMRTLFAMAGFSSINVRVQGWIAPNKTPVWLIPVLQTIEKTPLRSLGLSVCCIARVGECGKKQR